MCLVLREKLPHRRRWVKNQQVCALAAEEEDAAENIQPVSHYYPSGAAAAGELWQEQHGEREHPGTSSGNPQLRVVLKSPPPKLPRKGRRSSALPGSRPRLGSPTLLQRCRR